MRIKSIMLAGIILLAQSCSQKAAEENNQDEVKTPVRVHVSDFSFSNENFPDAQTRAGDDPNNYTAVKAIDIAIFAAGNKQVYAATQIKDDATTYTTFGEFECSLPIGTYTMVVVARSRSKGDEFTITSPTQAAYTSERARETFCCTQSITVTGTAPVDISPVMNRVMAQFQLLSTDQAPSAATTLRRVEFYSKRIPPFQMLLPSHRNGLRLRLSADQDADSSLLHTVPIVSSIRVCRYNGEYVPARAFCSSTHTS